MTLVDERPEQTKKCPMCQHDAHEDVCNNERVFMTGKVYCPCNYREVKEQ